MKNLEFNLICPFLWIMDLVSLDQTKVKQYEDIISVLDLTVENRFKLKFKTFHVYNCIF